MLSSSFIQKYQEEFKEEFGIHFKDSKGKLQFALVFLEEFAQKLL